MSIVKLHGKLGRFVGKDEWKLNVSSVGEAMHAVNSQSNDSIRKFFLKRENMYSGYDVLINNVKTNPSENIKLNDLTISRDDIERIDIIPVLEGSFIGSWAGILLGGVGLFQANNATAALTSIMLMVVGVSNLLSEPPELPAQKAIANPSTDPTKLANSYLFNGPVNTINEGGPVPLGYGRLIIGSQVIMASHGIRKVLVREAGRVR
tara:strand:- start:59 stop:679 length:621 start_codon:yes stop_codon:yes gene_type:complete